MLKRIVCQAALMLGVCVPVFAEPFEKLALRLQQGIEGYPNIKIAVLEFPYIDGRQSDGSMVVQERLTTLFAKNKKITVIERNLLQKVAGELKLQATGAMDEASTQKMGKLLGAEAILTGTLNEVSDKEVEINARVLIIQTAKIAAAEKIVVKRNWPHTSAPRGPSLTNAAAMIARLNENEKYTFSTVVLKSGKVQRTYYKEKKSIAVELIGKSGRLLKRTGQLPDGFYAEYYADGALKTEKTLIKSKEYGPVKTYLAGGILQNEAHYFAGKLEGPVKIYGQSGKVQLEQGFKNGIPDGYFREYDANGRVKTETFYKDGLAAASPAETAAAETITVTQGKLARGLEFTFYEEKKYRCRIVMDTEFNILSKQGQCPSGVARLYSRAGAVEKEFKFEATRLTSIKVLSDGESVLAERSYTSGD